MVGTGYWSTGITVSWLPPSSADGIRFGASLDFQDAGFCDSRSTEGTLATRYMIGDMGLRDVLDMLIRDAERLGISFGLSGLRPALYAKQDGEDGEEFYPADWRDQLAREADRVGWECNYRTAAS